MLLLDSLHSYIKYKNIYVVKSKKIKKKHIGKTLRHVALWTESFANVICNFKKNTTKASYTTSKFNPSTTIVKIQVHQCHTCAPPGRTEQIPHVFLVGAFSNLRHIFRIKIHNGWNEVVFHNETSQWLPVEVLLTQQGTCWFNSQFYGRWRVWQGSHLHKMLLLDALDS